MQAVEGLLSVKEARGEIVLIIKHPDAVLRWQNVRDLAFVISCATQEEHFAIPLREHLAWVQRYQAKMPMRPLPGRMTPANRGSNSFRTGTLFVALMFMRRSAGKAFNVPN